MFGLSAQIERYAQAVLNQRGSRLSVLFLLPIDIPGAQYHAYAQLLQAPTLHNRISKSS